MTKLGGKADVFVLPDTEEEAAFVIRYAYINNIPLLTYLSCANNLITSLDLSNHPHLDYLICDRF